MATSRKAGRPPSTPVKNAAASTLRAMTPTVSRLSANGLTPVRRIARVGGLPGGEAGELGRDRLAEHDCAGGAGERDAGGVRRRAMALVDRRAIAGRYVGGVDQVLDCDRDAVQRPARCFGITL